MSYAMCEVTPADSGGQRVNHMFHGMGLASFFIVLNPFHIP